VYSPIVTTRTVGILHPGEMGAAVSACLTARGHTVLWCGRGRSPATTDRAERAGLTCVDSLAELAGRTEVVLSICPPHAALEVAQSLPRLSGVYVDANAVSPALSRRVGMEIADRGATYVDGSIIGTPPSPSNGARLYLSGDEAAAVDVATLFGGTQVDARVLRDDPVAASTLKMAYAAWTKGTQALLVAIRELASSTGIEQPLLEEWAASQPSLTSMSQAASVASAKKGWRWTAEMEQIAATFAESGLPDGFHRAAAEIFRRHTH
jgi:3-hydroxyisobutyrate dehydrogenase-like beta-hydroxyacid dehydrogenase